MQADDKLALAGPGLVTDEELIALVLGPAAAARLASLAERSGGLGRLLHAGVAELTTLDGLGPRAASRLKAALELGRRAIDRPLQRGSPIKNADDVYERMRGRLVPLEQEELHVLGLDSMNRLMVHFVAGVGTVNQVYASPRDVFRPLVRESAPAVVVVHNHPSGLAMPSRADEELTARLVEAGSLLGVTLIDHVVVARSGRFSFAEHGRLS
jgi:DNA repair protein RadC